MEFFYYLTPLFFLTSIVYSMAGFGGGSTYLALMALVSFPYEAMPQTALLCNLVVAGGGCYCFIREGHLSLKRVLPFIVTSVPFAVFGGMIPVGRVLFTFLLALALLSAGLHLLISAKGRSHPAAFDGKKAWKVGLPGGALIGLVSGLVGIGGGIFLSPLLMIAGWADSRQAAAAASLFILVNSIAGLAGQIVKGGFPLSMEILLPLLVAVFLGGQIGSRLGSKGISRPVLQRITAVLICSVSVRLLWGLAAGGTP